MITRANRYVRVLASPDVESMRQIASSWPKSKSACYALCISILPDWRPSPVGKIWVTFGFCACPDEYVESKLVIMYKTLFQRCTFDEFWHAYDESSLMDLFDRHGLKEDCLCIPNLEIVLEGSPLVFYSVWYLKQFAVDETERVVPRFSVFMDYGFNKCLSPSLVKDLKGIYKRLFLEARVDPVKLHEACVAGNLFKFASGFVKINKGQRKKFARLMKNLYPLSTYQVRRWDRDLHVVELEFMRGWDIELRVVDPGVVRRWGKILSVVILYTAYVPVHLHACTGNGPEIAIQNPSTIE
ncbi:predicted protein [Postia placenta Mad-698-R]|nr:predicted protein [Postia placenta Mad-698-R]